MKIEVFREMYELNQAFERIIEGLRRLEKSRSCAANSFKI